MKLSYFPCAKHQFFDTYLTLSENMANGENDVPNHQFFGGSPEFSDKPTSYAIAIKRFPISCR
jgi:hypothetical protein